MQDAFPSFDETELKRLDSEVATKTAAVAAVKEELKSAETELRSQAGRLSLAALGEGLGALQAEVAGLESSLASASSWSGGRETEADHARAAERRSAGLSAWRSRKRVATEMLDAILESYPKKRADLCQDAGVETDEDLNLTLPKS